MTNTEKALKRTRELIEQSRTTTGLGVETRFRTAGAERRAEFAAQANKGAADRYQSYRDQLTELHKYAPELMDYAEATEGHCDTKVFTEMQEEAEEMAEHFQQEAASLSESAKTEVQNYANYWHKRAEAIEELRGIYGIGRAKKIKHMPGYKILENLFK